ncbi:odorant receptor 67c-like [Prorops nasuta]|uniref:odorant receptor 67c-like n=1 Tax=Prorops nasuta TaxID=863751 RepID=UPI0034CDF744
MMGKATPLRAISFTKASVAIVCSWPPPLTSSKLQNVVFEILWFLAFISAFLLLLPLLYSVYLDRHDPVVLSKSITLACAVLQINIKMVCYKKQRSQFQAFLFEMEKFCKYASKRENKVLQSYVDRLKNVHATYIICCYFTTCVILCGPILLKQPFPTDAKYPFPIENLPMRSLIYLHQVFVGFQASAAMATDIQISLLLWYIAAKFDILTIEFTKSKATNELDTNLAKYQDLLQYATKVINAARILPVITVCVTSIGVVFASLNIISDQPVAAKVQYVIVAFVAGTQLFMCAWAADNLIYASERVGLGAYSSKWYSWEAKSQRNIMHVLSRCRKPIVIKVGGILPSLSLQYYSAFIYKSFSYLAAVRIMLG